MADKENSTLTGSRARELVNRMGEAVVDFLASLSADQRRKAQFGFEDTQNRTFWAYTPIPRAGLCLAELDGYQRRMAQQVVATGLSRTGYITVSTVMGLETTLDYLESWERPVPDRDPRLYYLSVFGTPHSREPWGWQYEGHHVSLNFTIVDGRIVSPTPTFFGSNPAEAPLGPTATLRPLAGVEDLARDLVHSLEGEQRKRAILASVAPSDIVTRNRPYVGDEMLHLEAPHEIEDWMARSGISPAEVDSLRYRSQANGLVASEMSPAQLEILRRLIEDYIGRMPDELAEIELQRLNKVGLSTVHFAWAGGLERREPHYYRLQGGHFLVEYDNTQNDANHIHSVWRDPANDFGADILARHYAHSH